MNKEGPPSLSRFNVTIVTCSIDDDNDALEKNLRNKQQGDEKQHSKDDEFSPAKFAFYARTWYSFYAAEKFTKQFFMFALSE